MKSKKSSIPKFPISNFKLPIILGIDPGFATTGYAFITEDQKILSFGVIKTPAKTEFSQRLKTIHQDLNQLIKKYRPSAVAVEKIYFAKNAKTAIDVGQARGVILLTLMLNNIPLFEFTPLQVKQATCGYGKADKCQIQNMIKSIFKLKQIPKPDDAADALAVALTYLSSKKFNDKIK